MPTRPEFPDYARRAREQFERVQPDRNQSAFAKRTGLLPHQVSRWLTAPPERFASLELFAEKLGTVWEWLIVGVGGARRIEEWHRERLATEAVSRPSALPGPIRRDARGQRVRHVANQ